MKKAVIAPHCLQIYLHQGPTHGRRLAKFFKLINRVNSDIAVECPDKELKEKDLRDCKLIISTTRRVRKPYKDNEIDLIEKYTQTGGNLLIMSNHDKFSIQDSRLASRFGFKFDYTCFKSNEKSKRMIIRDFNHLTHPILKNSNDLRKTLQVEINNCSNINKDYKAGTVILRINPAAINKSSHKVSPDDNIFALAIDKGEYSKLGNHGRIFGISDSGIIGEPTQNNPGPGLEVGDNYLFMSNVIKWLLSIQDD